MPDAHAPPSRARSGAVTLDLPPAATGAGPADAPPPPEEDAAPRGRAMGAVVAIGARRGAGLGRWFWGLLGTLLAFALGVAAWEFAAGLAQRNAWLGWAALALTGGLALVCAAILAREALALSRLSRIDDLHRAAAAAVDLAGARALLDRLDRFYAARPDTRWGRDALREGREDAFDAEALLSLAERRLLAPLDAAATREVEAAARQVAAVTALVPVPLADVAAAGTANLRMIRRVAEIYGGRAGTLGSWRLARAVATHLVATGAVAAGDDLVHSFAGGHLLGRLSRRFGEGVVNGALTARVGIAAMEVCRPLPFVHAEPPRVTAILARSVRDLFPDPARPDSARPDPAR